MKTQKSMLELVKEQKQILKFDPTPTNEKLLDFAINVIKHEELLSQQPHIGMFVPAVCKDGVWRVLEEPKHYELWRKYGSFTQYREHLTSVCEPYFQAKSNVIFKGWEFTAVISELTLIESDLYDLYFDLEQNECHISTDDVYMKIHTIENLVKFNLEMI